MKNILFGMFLILFTTACATTGSQYQKECVELTPAVLAERSKHDERMRTVEEVLAGNRINMMAYLSLASGTPTAVKFKKVVLVNNYRTAVVHADLEQNDSKAADLYLILFLNGGDWDIVGFFTTLDMGEKL